MYMYFPIALAKHISYQDYYYNKTGMIKIVRCPNCNELIGLFVLRFFDKVEDGD